VAIKKASVKSKKSIAGKKSAIKKAAVRGRPKGAVSKASTRKAATKKGAAISALNVAENRLASLAAQRDQLKAELQACQKRAAGLEKLVSGMGASVKNFLADLIKKEMSGLGKPAKRKTRKKRAAKAEAKVPEVSA
jgi:hypothetical protein